MIKKSNYQTVVSTIGLFFSLMLVFFIPAYRTVFSYLISGWLLFSIFEFNYKVRFLSNFTTGFKKQMFVLQIVIFSAYFLSMLIDNDSKEASDQVVKKLSFLIFPLIFVFSGETLKINKHLYLKLFVLSNIIFSIVCLFTAFYRSIEIENGNFLFNSHDQYGNSYFFSSKLSVFHHRGYFSMFIVFSTAILFYLKDRFIVLKKKSGKFLYFAILALFSVMVFFMSSRAGIASLILLLTYRFYISIKNRRLRFLSIIVLLILIIPAVKNKRVQQGITELKNFKDVEHVTHEKTPGRIVLWISAVDLIKENILFGTGTDNFHEKYFEIYDAYNNKGLKLLKNERYNVHNQYLEFFVLFGIGGFILIITLFVIPLIHAIKRKNSLMILFLLITIFNFLFESMFDTVAGIVFFLFFLNFFVFSFPEEKTD
jgi:O-antigen ligase